MKSKYGFTKYTLKEFEEWFNHSRIARTIRTVQHHHTYLPNYSNFKGNNHFDLQRSMQRHHVHSNGWQDIGQHFTTFPDGTILSGRSLEKSPACIYGFNANSICIEHLGDFDKNKDEMTAEQQATAVEMTAIICSKFNIPANTDKIVYHHWFNLSNGQRNNGNGGNKSCPGTAFFGGNKVENCEANFIPGIIDHLKELSTRKPVTPLKKYVAVTASKLNIRQGPGTKYPKVADREAAVLGSILRIYDEQNGWYKISASTQHWVYAKYTVPVFPAWVNASSLNARTGPGLNYSRIGNYLRNHELWIEETKGDWCKVNVENTWVSKRYLNMDAMN